MPDGVIEPPTVKGTEVKLVHLEFVNPSGQSSLLGPLQAHEQFDPELERHLLMVRTPAGAWDFFVKPEDQALDEPPGMYWYPITQTWVRVIEMPEGPYHVA